MSIREQIIEYMADRDTATRAEFFEAFGECRKALSRMVGLGELSRTGDTYRFMGRAQNKFRGWTHDEQIIVREHLDEGLDVLAQMLPGRSRNAIKCKAEEMSLLVTRSRSMKSARAWNTTKVPAYTRGNLSPVVRSCIAEAA